MFNLVKVIAAGLSIVISGPLSAADLFTSPLTLQTSRDGFRALSCVVSNVGRVARSGVIEIYDGASVISAGSFNGVAPGGLTGISADHFSNATPITAAYCKIVVRAQGSESESAAASAVRGSLLVLDSNGNSMASAEAR